MVTISEATDAERDWCAKLMAGSDPWITLGRGLEECQVRCRHPEYLLHVARSGDEPCGFLLIHPRGVAGSPYIASIAVAAPFRSQGIGARLMAYAEALYAGRSRYIFLCVSSFNHRARSLYERLGYTLVGELKDYAIDGASEYLMHKRLVRT